MYKELKDFLISKLICQCLVKITSKLFRKLTICPARLTTLFGNRQRKPPPSFSKFRGLVRSLKNSYVPWGFSRSLHLFLAPPCPAWALPVYSGTMWSLERCWGQERRQSHLYLLVRGTFGKGIFFLIRKFGGSWTLSSIFSSFLAAVGN